MARFYGSLKGNRGQATRTGTKKSGIEGHIRGWDVGTKVRCFVNEDGNDVVAVFLTSGSHGRMHDVLLGEFTEKDIQQI